MFTCFRINIYLFQARYHLFQDNYYLFPSTNVTCLRTSLYLFQRDYYCVCIMGGGRFRIGILLFWDKMSTCFNTIIYLFQGEYYRVSLNMSSSNGSGNPMGGGPSSVDGRDVAGSSAGPGSSGGGGGGGSGGSDVTNDELDGTVDVSLFSHIGRGHP